MNDYKQFFRQYPIFFKYFLGDFVGKVADQYFNILLPFLIFTFTQDTLLLGLCLGLNAIGRIIMLPIGGVITDRFQPQKFLFLNNIVQAIGLAIILLLGSSINIYSVAIIALVFGLSDGLSLPAGIAVIPKMIQKQDLLRANSLVQGLEQLTGMIGVLIAGFVIAKIGINAGVIGGLILYIIAAISYSLILNIKLPQSDTKLNWIDDIKAGFLEVKRNSVIKTTLLFSITSNIFVNGCLTIGLLLLFKNKFGVGADFYSWIGVFFAIGFLIGLPLVSRIKKVAFPGKFILLFSFIYFLVFLLLATLPNIWLIFATLTLTGIVVAFDAAINTTWVQLSTSSTIMGRIASFQVFAAIAVDPIGQALASFFGQYNVEWIFYISGFGYLLAAILNYIFNPTMRKRFDLEFDKSAKLQS
jgi:MFS family permease